MTKLFKHRSLSFMTATLLLLSTLFLVSIIFFYFQNRLYDISIQNTYDQNLVESNNIKNFINESLESKTNVLHGTVLTIENFDNPSQNQLDQYFSELFDMNEYLVSIEILNMDKIVTSVYPSSNQTVGFDRSYEVNKLNILVTDTHKWTTPYTTPYYDGVIVSVVHRSSDHYYIANYNLEFIDEIYASISDTTPDKNLLIHDGYGIFIYDSEGENEVHRMKWSLFEQVVSSEYTNNPTLLEYDGGEYIFSTAYYQQQDWYITVYEDNSNARSLFFNITLIVSIISLVSLVVYISTTIFMNFMFRKNIGDLTKKLEAITSGNLNTRIDNYFFKDFEPIASGFNQMTSSIKDSREYIENLAFYDHITGLRSRAFLNESFSNIAGSYENIIAIYLDISRFKIINDIYGYEIGTELLQAVAKRVQSLPIRNHIGFKSESDEMIILLLGDDYIDTVEETIKFISSNLQKNYRIKGNSIHINVSMGVSIFPDHADNPDDLISRSIIALHEAKDDKDVNYKIFDSKKTDEFTRKSQIEILIDNALKENELYIVAQPIVHSKQCNIRGFEVLSRWNSKDLGPIYPGEYVPIFERAKKVSQLDLFVLEEGIKLGRDIKKQYNKNFIISINLSVDTISKIDFVDKVKELITKYKYNPNYLELEVTESTIISDFDDVSKKFKQLAKLGVRFSEDDFGDGFSSLNYLTSLELNTLKISKNLTQSLSINDDNRILLQYIINLAKDLGFDTIIEGIEDQETLDICNQLNVDFIQGYFFFKPLPINEIHDLVKTKKE